LNTHSYKKKREDLQDRRKQWPFILILGLGLAEELEFFSNWEQRNKFKVIGFSIGFDF